MPSGRNGFLLYQNGVADGAVLAFGLTGSGAGGCNSRVDDLGVALGVYILALIAVSAGAGEGGVALRGAGGSGDLLGVLMCMTQDCNRFCFGGRTYSAGEGLDTFGSLSGLLSDLAAVPGMVLGRNGFLLYQNGVADGAVLAFGLTGSGAGGGNGLVDDFRVALGGYFGIGVAVIAAGALMGGVTLCDAGGRSNGIEVVVTQCFGITGLPVAADGAFPLFPSLIGTGRFPGHSPVTIFMAQCRHMVVLLGDSAAGALVGGVALVIAAGFLDRILHIVMSQCVHIGIVLDISAGVADMLGVSLGNTGGRDNGIAVAVAQSLRITGLLVAADGAFPLLPSLIGAGRFPGHSPVTIFVAQCRHMVIPLGVSAAGALVGGVALIGAGGFGYGILFIVVAQGIGIPGFVAGAV